jgi:hypothetical protein
MTKPTFSLRGLLGVTTFVALSCVVLMKPSVYWIYPIPFILCVLTVGAALRVTRSFWFSVTAGVVVHIVMTAAIDQLYSDTSYEFRQGWYSVYKMLHDDDSNDVITAFRLSLQFIAAFAVASIAAYVAQLIWPPKSD